MATSLNSQKRKYRKYEQSTTCRLFLFIALSLLIVGCKSEPNKVIKEVYKKISGQTMGTTYAIIYKPFAEEISKSAIDSILIDINLSVSTYIDTSTISKINKSAQYGQSVTILNNGKYVEQDRIQLAADPHFLINFKAANRVYLDTDGSFDPTVMPLVNYWGFGYTPKKPVTQVDSQKITQILENVALEKFTIEQSGEVMTCIKPTQAELDFSAIAKGYAVDYLSTYLKEQGVDDLMVEIGGEVYATGLNPKSSQWTIGLNTPDSKSQLTDFSNYIQLDGKAVASSGNYRIFYEVDGKKYSHEINPKTGYPERNSLLQACVIASNCMEADAIATALMVMGQKKAMAFIESQLQVEALLFVGNDKGEIEQLKSSGFSAYEADLTKLVGTN